MFYFKVNIAIFIVTHCGIGAKQRKSLQEVIDELKGQEHNRNKHNHGDTAGMEQNMGVLSAEKVTYIYQSKYQKVQVLADVSCDFKAGKFYAIVGQSGSGRTTMLSMLAGLGIPNESEAISEGKSIKKIVSGHHRRKNVFIVYQAFNFWLILLF